MINTFEIQAGGTLYNLCDGHKIEIYKGGTLEQLKPGDWVRADGKWIRLCRTETLFYGIALGTPFGDENPAIADSNIDNIGSSPDDYVWPDGSNVGLRLWFATASQLAWTRSGGYGVGSGAQIAENIPVSVQFGKASGQGGDFDLSVVDWRISDIHNINGLTGLFWTGGATKNFTIPADVKQAGFVFSISLPSMGYFSINIQVGSTDALEIVPLRGVLDNGWDASTTSLGNGQWRIHRLF